MRRPRTKKPSPDRAGPTPRSWFVLTIDDRPIVLNGTMPLFSRARWAHDFRVLCGIPGGKVARVGATEIQACARGTSGFSGFAADPAPRPFALRIEHITPEGRRDFGEGWTTVATGKFLEFRYLLPGGVVCYAVQVGGEPPAPALWPRLARHLAERLWLSPG